MCERERRQRGPWDIIHQHRRPFHHHCESILLFCSRCWGVERESRVTLCPHLLLILVLNSAAEGNTQVPRSPRGTGGRGGWEKRMLQVHWGEKQNISFLFDERMAKTTRTAHKKPWRRNQLPVTRMESTLDSKRATFPQNYHGSPAWSDEHLLFFNPVPLVVNTIPAIRPVSHLTLGSLPSLCTSLACSNFRRGLI